MSTVPDHILAHYASEADRLGPVAEAAALQGRSIAMREIFAHAATGGRLNLQQITERVRDGDLRGIDPWGLARLARVVALQDLQEEDADFALQALRHANRHFPPDHEHRRFHKLEVELLVEHGEFTEADLRLGENRDLRLASGAFLKCDLKNPFLRQDPTLYSSWSRIFNDRLVRRGWTPVRVTEGESMPFDRLSGAPVAGSGGTESHGTESHGTESRGTEETAPLVSVVMTTFRPDRHTLLAAVNSILEQTWQKIELILVDDASPQEFQSILDEVEALDPRLQVLRLTQNAGTYQARNAGMRLARGSLITGQDSDDWSHPQRISAQVDHLAENPAVPGVITSSVRTDENLVMMWRGRLPARPCEVSLMLRREVIDRIGGYIPARKAADGEFRMRASAASAEPVGLLRDSLYFIRVLPNSLSRGDFLPGWSHPTRKAFQRAYTYWHATAPAEELHVDPATPARDLQVPLPRRFHIDPPAPPPVDIVYVADWRGDEGIQRAAISELESLAAADFRIGVIQLDSWKYSQVRGRALISPIQDGINAGRWSLYQLEEPAEVGLMVVRDPRLMQFLPAEPSRLQVEKLMLFAEETLGPDSPDYDADSCARNAQQLFGPRPVWAATAAGMPGLEHISRDAADVLERPVPHVLLDSSWVHRPPRGPRARPAIGRHARRLAQSWPEDPATITAAWPTTGPAAGPAAGSVDVRVRGEATDLLEVTGEHDLPASWVVYSQHDLPARAFLNGLDFYVTRSARAHPHEVWEVLEAIAAGCVVILPESFRPLLGEAAIYAEPEQVQSRIHELWGNPTQMAAHRSRAAQILREQLLDAPGFVDLMRTLLTEQPAPKQSGESFAGNV